MHEKARAEQLVEEARQAIKEEAPIDRLRSLSGELQQVYHGLGAAGGRPETPGVPPQAREESAPGADEDVIDAEFSTSEPD